MGEDKTALTAAIRQRAEQWRKKLTDMSRRNTTLYFKHLKTGSLRLPDLNADIIDDLESGSALDLTTVMEWNADCEKRLSAVKAKARENEEERGIQTMFLALGMATWKSADGGKNPKAPIFLLPVTVTSPSGHATLTPSGDIMLNRVMLLAWEQEHKHSPTIFEDDDEIATLGIYDSLARVAEAGGALTDFQVSMECYLGNFSFAKMAMVEDLRKNEALLHKSRLVQAIVGDRESIENIRADAGVVEREELDDIDPFDETIVLEADEYQRQAIHSLTRFKADGVIDGPPGTGKSQTIANLIAALVRDGKRVLFVAEKRAALDAVLNRLTEAGLEEIVLDLHGVDARKKTVYERLRRRDESARHAEARPSAAPLRDLKKIRAKLNAYYRAVNRPLVGCDLNVRDVIARLGKLSVKAETLWYDDLDLMTIAQHEQAKEHIGLLATYHALFRHDSGAAWSQADFADATEAADAIRFVTESRANLVKLLERIVSFSSYFGHEVLTFSDLGTAVRNLVIIKRMHERFKKEVALLDPEELLPKLAPAISGGLTQVWALLTNGQYRSAAKKLRNASREPKTPVGILVSDLAEFEQLPATMRSGKLFDEVDSLVEEISKLWNSVKNVRDDLRKKTGEHLPDELHTVVTRLSHLEQNHRHARRIPEIRLAERELSVGPYLDIISEMKRTSVAPHVWTELADYAYYASFLEKAKLDQPELGGFEKDSFERLRAEFQDLDAKQLARSRVAVRRGSAEAYVDAKNKHKDEDAIFRNQLRLKARNMPVRKLVEKAGNILTALCPCWMASPLSVSQLLPGTELFDVVIFDEASQVVPEDAIPSIMRGARAIVAGDEKQLPPTSFFASESADAEEEDAEDEKSGELLELNVDGMESILDLMLGFTAQHGLNVHYRSLDESLIRFSNHEFYMDRLITFPSASKGDGGIHHVLVESPSNDGEELSSSAEIRRVIQLVFEHAEKRPQETLGIITLGLKHARRIEAALAIERKNRPDLDGFFARDGVNEAFFIKNLERVQGDERDAIILSFGYAKDGTGNLKNKLGPVNYAGGERRLNVAVTRAKTRMTVLSSFTEHDMNPTSFRSKGAQILSRYLSYARSGGTRLDDVAESEVEMNEFERDVFDTLTGKGMRLVPQLGVSKYRLDFAVLHPKIPNKFVLAIECDGAPYHSSATARDRDRLRQKHLENRGWKFHRIWSLDWHEQRGLEVDRVLQSYAAVITAPNRPNPSSDGTQSASPTNGETKIPINWSHAPQPGKPRGPKPLVGSPKNISQYTDAELHAIFNWVSNDGILRSDEEIIAEAVPALLFLKRGARIEERLQESLKKWHRHDESRSTYTDGFTRRPERPAVQSRPRYAREATLEIEEGAGDDDIMALLLENGIARDSIVDKRSQERGAIWVIADASKRQVFEELAEHGIRFTYAAGGGRATGHKPGWWARP